MSKIEIDKKTVKKIAKLSNLDLTEAELDRYTQELDKILVYIHEVAEVDVSDVNDAVVHNAKFQGEVLRDDETRESLPQDKVLDTAGEDRVQGKYIKTSKIV